MAFEVPQEASSQWQLEPAAAAQGEVWARDTGAGVISVEMAVKAVSLAEGVKVTEQPVPGPEWALTVM